MPFNKELWDLFSQFEEHKEQAAAKAESICSDFLGSNWNGETFKIEKMSGGMNNLVFKCSTSYGKVVLLRVQCEKDVMQLQNELIILMKLAEKKLGPELLGVFLGGRLEEFIPSRILTFEEAKNPGYSQHVARTMAKIHQIAVPMPKPPQMISFLKEWLEMIRKNGGDEFELWSQYSGISKNKFPAKISLGDLSKEIDQIEKYLKKNENPAKLTHNDLFAGNILLRDGYSIEEDGTVRNETGNENEDPLVIIDFEFGMYNYRGFDIGNFLNELGMTYFEAENSSKLFYTYDLPRLTDRNHYKAYCSAYLEETYKIIMENGQSLVDEGLTGNLQKDFALLQREVSFFQAVANLWWGIRNIIWYQEGWQSMDYASGFRDRLCLYFYLKELYAIFK